MANLCSRPYSSYFQSPYKHVAFSKPLIPISLVPVINSVSRSISLNERYPSLQINCSEPSSSSSIESHQYPSTTVVFIKGLSLSTSDGRLKNAFSKFGEVSRAKIVTDKKTKQPLGFAFVWFTSEKSAQLAVKEMNGKFFDGKFIFVTISKPGSCKRSGRKTPYKF